MGRASCSEPPDSAPISQDGLLQTENLDAANPENRRRARNRPEPAQELRDWEKQAQARAHARPYPPGIILEPAGFDEEHWTAPHSDTNLWTLQLADALGTRSQAVISAFMAQIEALCGKQGWDEEARQWRLDENEFSAALAMINSIKPKNEIEAAMAAQMVAVHLMQMKTAAYAIKFSGDWRSAAVAGKLARTFAQQIETLQRLRAPNRTKKQSIKVSKELHHHVHYYDARGARKIEHQPHEPPTLEPGECPALSGPQPHGRIVPRTSRKREAGV
jgi:hypothetical protein